MKIIEGKEIKGYGDGGDITRWYWGDTKVAVINERKREIEWCEKTCNFPNEVIEEIRSKMPNNPGVWVIEARRVRQTSTGGSIHIFVNNKDMDMNFADTYELVDGEWRSTTPDAELGKFVYACLWHPLDNTYQYSDRFKSLFDPDWNKRNTKKATDKETEENNFYFTFGSSEIYPYSRGQYVVVKASDRQEATHKFMGKYPHPFCDNVVNCAFYYDQGEWDSRGELPRLL